MRITAELSLYPLHDDPIPVILQFIGDIVEAESLDCAVNQMSTQIRGELADVIACVQTALQRAFAAGGSQVLVAKFLNSDLPIHDPPDLDAAG